MVVRVEGKVHGEKVSFTWVGGDRWEAVIPASLNGVYIVELTAYDEAGNVGYCTKYILTVDLASLCVHLEPYPYWAELKEEFGACAHVSEFYAEVVEKFCCMAKVSGYYAELLGG